MVFLFNKKIVLLSACLFFSLQCSGQEKVDLFEKKWITAQQLLSENEIPALLAIIQQMESLVKQDQPTQAGKVAYLQGEYWHAKEAWSKALSYLNTAIKNLEPDTSTQLILAETFLVSGYCFHELEDLEQALFSYKQSLKLKQKKLGKDHLKVSNLYFNIGFILQEQKALIKSDAAFQRGLDILKTIYPKENELFADFYEELGFNLNNKGDLNSANEYLKKAVAIKQETLDKQHESLVIPYEYLGRNYVDLEFFDEAINYFNKALQIVEKQPKVDVFQHAMLHFLIGKSYLRLKDYDKAFFYFDKAISIDKNNKFILPEVHRFRGVVESQKGNNEIAAFHFAKSEKGFKEDLKNGNEYLYYTYESIAKHHFKMGNYEQALKVNDEAITIVKALYKDQPIQLFENYLSKANYYQLLGDSLKAANYFSKAANTNGVSLDWQAANLIQLKNLVSLNSNFAQFHLRDSISNLDLTSLLQVNALLDTTIQLIDYINNNYQERSIKENFKEEYYKIFKEAVRIKYRLYTITKDNKYLKEAFVLSEKSRNLILLETLKSINAFELAGLPKSILEKEKTLRINITYLENKRFEENQKDIVNRSIIQELNGYIFDIKQEHKALLKKIEHDFPTFYQLKFESITTAVPDVQQLILTDDQSFIEYFIGNHSIYVFLIKRNDFQVFSLPRDKDLNAKIDQLRENIYSYRPSFLGAQTQLHDPLMKETNRLGFELYQALFQPFQHQLTRKVTIIADGILGYLPFDALSTQLLKKGETSEDLDYLLSDHLISYAHSINWLNGLFDKKDIAFEQNFIGIAPLFIGNDFGQGVADFRLGLGPLKYNQEEVEKIKRDVGGQIITGTKATRQSFLSNIQKGQVLHLATHGKSNDDHGDYSYLAFSEPTDSVDNQFLYVKDLFNLKIPAELVVLSACETGLGELKRGEGIVGIGKGFSYAGAKSMVTTLWRVSDNSTANFMPIFYKNLKKGLPKDEALWVAKNEFIQSYRNAAHPFFWSGYVAYGNMEPIDFQHFHFPFIFIILGGLIIVGFLLLINSSCGQRRVESRDD